MKRLALLIALVVAPAALAHGPTAEKAGYVSTVAGLRPNVVGVTATILGSDQQLQLTNYSGKTIEVLDAQQQPMYRFDAKGIHQLIDGKWLRIAPGSSYAWHDRRIRWTRATPPRRRARRAERGAPHLLVACARACERRAVRDRGLSRVPAKARLGRRGHAGLADRAPRRRGGRRRGTGSPPRDRAAGSLAPSLPYGEPTGQAGAVAGSESMQWIRCWITGLTTVPRLGREVVREVLVEDVLRRHPAADVRVPVAAAGGEVVRRELVGRRPT